jgi:hypothetical protein
MQEILAIREPGEKSSKFEENPSFPAILIFRSSQKIQHLP